MPEANQNPQLVNRGPAGETKMPLMGNFPIPPASTSKQDKKRKGGPPQQGLGSQMHNPGESSVRGSGQLQSNKVG